MPGGLYKSGIHDAVCAVCPASNPRCDTRDSSIAELHLPVSAFTGAGLPAAAAPKGDDGTSLLAAGGAGIPHNYAV